MKMSFAKTTTRMNVHRNETEIVGSHSEKKGEDENERRKLREIHMKAVRVVRMSQEASDGACRGAENKLNNSTMRGSVCMVCALPHYACLRAVHFAVTFMHGMNYLTGH